MKVINTIAEIRINAGRGVSLVAEVKNAIYVATALKLFFDLSLKMAVATFFMAYLGFWLIGIIDTKYLKLMQKEAELSSSKYNPHLNKISKLMKGGKHGRN